MTFSMKRMYAIFQKDLKELSKNMFVGSSVILPIFLALVYGKMNVVGIDISFLVFNLNFVAVTFFIQSAIIAEEREKNTLRGYNVISRDITGNSWWKKPCKFYFNNSYSSR